VHQVLQILLLVGEEPVNQEVLSVDSVAAVVEHAVLEVDMAEVKESIVFPTPNNQAHHHRPNIRLLYLLQLRENPICLHLFHRNQNLLHGEDLVQYMSLPLR
jgi:hypothetical protein